MNFLEETLHALKDFGKSSKDVRWCGNRSVWFTWEEFVEMSKDVEYPDWGDIRIAIDLLIVGDDWWLERQYCEDEEWWHFETMPKKPKKHTNKMKLITNEGDSELDLDSINRREIKEVAINEVFKKYKLTLTVIRDGIKIKDDENMDKLAEYWKKKNFTCLLSNLGELYLTDGEDKMLIGIITDPDFSSWYEKIN